jgi:IS30 family transposase
MQKGAIENESGFISLCIPEGASLDDFTDRRIGSIKEKINLKPSKLDFSYLTTEFFK